MKNKTQQRLKTYERLILHIIAEIENTPKEEEAKFILLKKRANKYLRKYEALRIMINM